MSDRYVSHSELATWRRCNRKWYLTYWEGLRLPVEQVTGIRRIGTRIHLDVDVEAEIARARATR